MRKIKIMISTLFLIFLISLHAKEAILVTGGAGYIGTQTCKALDEAGYLPVIYDNLCTGHLEAVKRGVLEVGDIADRVRLEEVIDKYHPIAVIHLAALKAVGESVADPAKYYKNNVLGSIVLLDVLKDKKVDKIIFSSSAAVYGDHFSRQLLTEEMQLDPINPYGTTKCMVEQILKDFDTAYGMKYVTLRYFNAAGADLSKECGERGKIPYNLIPLVVRSALEDRAVNILGTDYSTPDGSCIRDYIHVVDLADAHVKALKYLLEGNESIALNLGTGKGASVKQVIEAARAITEKAIASVDSPRRPGDPPFLIARISLAQQILEWEPQYSDLQTIIETEWKWMQGD